MDYGPVIVLEIAPGLVRRLNVTLAVGGLVALPLDCFVPAVADCSDRAHTQAPTHSLTHSLAPRVPALLLLLLLPAL